MSDPGERTDAQGDAAESVAGTRLPCVDVVFRRPRVASLLVALGFLALLPGLIFSAALFGMGGALAATGLAIFAFVMAFRLGTVSRGGRWISLDSDRITIVDAAGEVQLVPLTDVASGYEVPTRRAAVLVLRNGSHIVARLEGDGPARLLEHAGVGPTQRALTMPLRRMLGAFTIGFTWFWSSAFAFTVLARLLAIDGGLPRLLAIDRDLSRLAIGLVLAAISTIAVVMRFGSPRVVVGADGIRLLGTLRQRFVPYEAIPGAAAIMPNAQDPSSSVRVKLHDGSAVVLPTVAAPAERIEGLVRRIVDRSSAHSAGAVTRFAVLARGGRSVAAWKEDVARMAQAPGGFRAQALGREDFERVLADGGAPAEQRVGAALALHAIDPEGAPARIRVAADTSADDALRDALALASEGEVDEAAVERAAARKATRTR